MRQILKRYLGREDYLEVYARPEASDRFDVGRLLAMDDQYVLMNTCDENGRDDGLSLRLIENIICVQADTLYLKKLCLFEKSCASRYAKWKNVQSDLMDALLMHAYETGSGVSLELENGDETTLVGCLLEEPGEVIALRQLDAYGDDDGVAYVRRDQLARVDCDSVDVQKRIEMSKC